MEWKIGEIKQINGEWYQCVRAEKYECQCCDLRNKCTDNNDIKIVTCHARYRNDRTYVVFKKLEKVGEPYKHCGKLYQCYKLPMEIEVRLLPNNCNPIGKDNLVEIEIKQNKEDMEEEREYSEEEFKNNPRFKHHKPIEQISNMKKMKPFNLAEAKAGKSVCTRDGQEVRIICFDAKLKNYSIVALVKEKGSTQEYLHTYTNEGRIYYKNPTHSLNLVMPLKKKTGWVNIFANGEYTVSNIYTTEQSAKVNAIINKAVDTIQIEWYE